jgi:hypothetical protein
VKEASYISCTVFLITDTTQELGPARRNWLARWLIVLRFCFTSKMILVRVIKSLVTTNHLLDYLGFHAITLPWHYVFYALSAAPLADFTTPPASLWSTSETHMEFHSSQLGAFGPPPANTTMNLYMARYSSLTQCATHFTRSAIQSTRSTLNSHFSSCRTRLATMQLFFRYSAHFKWSRDASR